MRAHPVTKALLAGALCLGLTLWRASADTPTGTTAAGRTSAAQTPAGAPQPSSSTASAPTDADDAAANALLDQGRSALKQRLNGAGQDAREQLNNAEHEYQHSSDQIDAARTQALVGTVLPGLIEGSVKGVVAAPGAITAVPAPAPPAPLLPISAAPGPIWIDFEHSSNRPPGYAHVVSAPPGIDCPPTCSASFGQGVNVTIQATADSSSIIEVVECYAWTAGPTTQRLPGNSMACGWPGLVAARGGRTIIRVNGSDSSAPGMSASGPSGSTGGPTALGGGVVGGAGVGVTQTGSNPGVGPGGGTSGGSSYGSAGNGTPSASSSCTELTSFIGYKVVLAPDGFVVGWLTNKSNQTVYVRYTFARGGKPYPPETGGVTIQPGQTVGGEGGGIWASANDVDSNPPAIFWNAVLQSDVNQGKQCPSPW
jgi:hypothetical protein